jgi:hypothetical protein
LYIYEYSNSNFKIKHEQQINNNSFFVGDGNRRWDSWSHQHVDFDETTAIDNEVVVIDDADARVKPPMKRLSATTMKRAWTTDEVSDDSHAKNFVVMAEDENKDGIDKMHEVQRGKPGRSAGTSSSRDKFDYEADG